MKKKTIVLLSALCLAACATNKQNRNEGGDALAAVATVSALLVALPLIPVVQAYDAINDTQGKRRRKAQALAQRFDPVYEKRVRMIKARDPQTDAESLIQRDVVVLLPSVPGGIVYPGLTTEQRNRIDHAHNARIIAETELASYLMQLMARDPAHDTEAGRDYYGEPYRKFIDAYFAYKESFNATMLTQCRQVALSDCLHG